MKRSEVGSMAARSSTCRNSMGGSTTNASASTVASRRHSSPGHVVGDEVASDSSSLSARRSGVSPLHLSVLVLNRNFAAIHVISAQRAFCLLWKDLAEIVHVENGQFMTYDFNGWREESELKAAVLTPQERTGDWVKAVSFEIEVPRIIRLRRYDRMPRNTVKFNRRNVFLRDAFQCQYCGNRYATGQLSLDHVVPRSRGGVESWENIVCACLKCNVRKGDRTPVEASMKLLREPIKPTKSPMIVRQLKDPRYQSWKLFLHGHD